MRSQSEHVDRRRDRVGSRVLTRGGGPSQTSGRRQPIRRQKTHGINPELGRVHAEPDDAVGARGAGSAKSDELTNVLNGKIRPECAVDIEDQPTPSSGLPLGCLEPRIETSDDVGELLPVLQMASRSEEGLPVAETVSRTVDDRLEREAFPILGRSKNALNEPEDRQEAGQVVVGEQLLDAGGRERNTMRGRQLGDSLRAHRALDMAMQFDLR